MASYSVQDMGDNQLDQFKKAQKKLMKRNRIKLIKQEYQPQEVNLSVAKLNPDFSIDSTIRSLTKNIITLKSLITKKKLDNPWMVWTILDKSLSDYFAVLNKIQYNFLVLRNSYKEFLKITDLNKVEDYKIILNDINDYFTYWNSLYNEINFVLHIRNPNNALVVRPVTQNNYLPAHDIIIDKKTNYRILTGDTRNGNDHSRDFKLPSKSPYTDGDVLFPLVIINYEENKILRDIEGTVKTLIKQTPQLGAGLHKHAIPYYGHSMKKFVHEDTHNIPPKYM